MTVPSNRLTIPEGPKQTRLRQKPLLRLTFAMVFLVVLQSTHAISAISAETEPTGKQIDIAVQRGIRFLLNRQNNDGSFGKSGEQYFADCGVAALCGLALLADGNTPETGIGGKTLEKIISFLLHQTQENGFIGKNSTRGMYGHGFATQFLAECYGMQTGDTTEYRTKLRKAIDLIVQTQNQEIRNGQIGGGWRYRPIRETVADVSVSIVQIMALRSAKNAGLYVPKECIDRAVVFLEACRNDDGGFRYMLIDGRSGFARSAGAIAALQSAGQYSFASPDPTDLSGKMFAYLQQTGFPGRLVNSNPAELPEYYHYGQYYAAIALSVADSKCPISWKQWYGTMATELITDQRDDGSWTARKGEMPVDCTTAMSVFILCVPRKKVPMLMGIPDDMPDVP